MYGSTTRQGLGLVVAMLLCAWIAGCGGESDDEWLDAGPADGRIEDALPADLLQPDMQDAGPTGPTGFIGGPCEKDEDCTYSGGVCLRDGFPGGTCSQACDQYCPDLEGHPMTFCVDATRLPPAAAALGAGACFSRCDFELFPQSGCRGNNSCVRVSRAGSTAETFVCLPGQSSDLVACHLELAAAGLGFEPTVVADAHPDPPNESLTCTVQDPVYLFSPVHGVELTLFGKANKRYLVACNAAKAIAATADDLKAQGVVSIDTMGTYNCRVIAGTTSLSRHAYGDAIDIAGVALANGTTYTLTNDWEHDTSSPTAPGAKLLYDAAYRWYNALIWNIILTPNYNVAHDDHFHVDLTPGSHFIQFKNGDFFFSPYFGPAPYAD